MLDVRHERHKSCPLDRASEVTLIFGLKASAAATIHTSVWVGVCQQPIDIFVINMIDRLSWFSLFFHVLCDYY